MNKFLLIPVTLFTIVLMSCQHLQGQASRILRESNTGQPIVQFIFCSDVHFGLTKEDFRGKKKISSDKVNAAMIKQMNRLPKIILPLDTGVSAGKAIGWIDAVVITGDVANRQETGIQSASKSWQQFRKRYLHSLRLRNFQGAKAPVLVTPGNHDMSNAVGFHRAMQPLKDNASLRGMYNLMMEPAHAKSGKDFDPSKDRVHYSLDLGNMHYIFISLWPDSSEQVWIEKDLSTVKDSTPVFLFTHSIPDVEARFFQNPNGNRDVNPTDKFENLVPETFKDSRLVTDTAWIEQRAFAAFVKRHPNIKAYFHGHENYSEFYNWTGPDRDIRLHCFRADSPMKGRYSVKDETQLSFELVTINTVTREITVRECLWNKEPSNSANPVNWGSSISLSLK